MEHVLGVQLGVNIYSAVFSGPEPGTGMLSIAQAGLDKGGAAGVLRRSATRTGSTRRSAARRS